MRFFQGVPDQERAWIEHQLNEVLTQLRGSAGVVGGASPPAGETAGEELSAGPAETLAANGAPLDPPSDCSWQRRDELDAITFLQRGRFAWGTVSALAFMNAFWNGIVATLLLSLFDGRFANQAGGFGWWGVFVFLIPFEAAGLVMFVGLIVALIEPSRKTIWRFGDRAIERHMTWFAVGPVWRYWVDRLSRIELQGAGAQNTRSRQWVNLGAWMPGAAKPRFV